MARVARSTSMPAYPYRGAKKASDLSYRRKLEDLETSGNEETLVEVLTQAVTDAENGDAYLRHKRFAIESMKFYDGEQWLDNDLNTAWAPEWRYRATRNICFGIAETMRGALTDLRPTPVFTADYEDSSSQEAEQMRQLREQGQAPPRYDILTDMPRFTDRDVARHLNEFYQAELDYREEDDLMMDVTFDFGVSGRAVRKLWWDKTEGRVGITQYDTLDCIHDPYCDTRLWKRGAKYTVLCREMDADKIRRAYGVSKEKMRKVLDSGGLMDYPGRGLYGRPQRMSNYSQDWTAKTYGDPMERQRLKVYEIWTNPDTEFDFEFDEERPLGGRQGSIFVLCGDQLLYRKENPYRNNGRIFIPIVTFLNYSSPRDPYGFGDLKSVLPNQVTINMMLSQVVMCLILTANPQLLYEEGAVNRNFLNNKPGLAIEVAKGMWGRVQRLEGAQPPPGLFQVIADMLRSSEEISSVTDLMRGAMPQTHTPSAAITQQQQMGFNRVRAQAKRMNKSYREQARTELWMLQNFWDFLPPNGIVPLEVGAEWRDMSDRFRELEFDVDVAAKSELPTTMGDKITWASQVMQLGGMDVEEFVKFTGIPVSDRFKEKLRLASDMQILQAEIQTEQLRGLLEQVRAQRSQMAMGGGAFPTAGMPMGEEMPPEVGMMGAGQAPAPAQQMMLPA